MALVHGVLKMEDGDWKRFHDTGVKHNRANMALVFQQKGFFCTCPKLLILPIMKLADALGCKGGKHQAILIAWDAKVHKSCQMTQNLEPVTFLDLKKATETLKCFVKASACIMLNDDNTAEIRSLHDGEKKMMTESLQQIRDSGEGKVCIPQL